QADALDKVRAGVTTLSEVLRVVAFGSAQPVKCPACGQPQASASRFCPHCGAPRQNQSDRRKSAESAEESILVR
ncbi:MAG TPA: zinc-ribbon domain-containing protein, partial [Candidatus Acidoferrales bacterium]